ncbi:hypothetical protein [Sphingomonas sp. R86521]|uniref:hypothetical protein n=1 Tax=Sphingomonas sp. R86521 TaxID=3093860 RepID=UPI0036D2F2A9
MFGDAGKLFGEPAWDILLDLFIQQCSGKRVSVTDCGIASCRPASTAIRHIQSLEVHGLIEREKDETDARRSWIKLSSKAMSALRRLCGDDPLHDDRRDKSAR